jgi:hypothetical protein
MNISVIFTTRFSWSAKRVVTYLACHLHDWKLDIRAENLQ